MPISQPTPAPAPADVLPKNGITKSPHRCQQIQDFGITVVGKCCRNAALSPGFIGQFRSLTMAPPCEQSGRQYVTDKLNEGLPSPVSCDRRWGLAEMSRQRTICRPFPPHSTARISSSDIAKGKWGSNARHDCRIGQENRSRPPWFQLKSRKLDESLRADWYLRGRCRGALSGQRQKSCLCAVLKQVA